MENQVNYLLAVNQQLSAENLDLKYQIFCLKAKPTETKPTETVAVKPTETKPTETVVAKRIRKPSVSAGKGITAVTTGYKVKVWHAGEFHKYEPIFTKLEDAKNMYDLSKIALAVNTYKNILKSGKDPVNDFVLNVPANLESYLNEVESATNEQLVEFINQINTKVNSAKNGIILNTGDETESEHSSNLGKRTREIEETPVKVAKITTEEATKAVEDAINAVEDAPVDDATVEDDTVDAANIIVGLQLNSTVITPIQTVFDDDKKSEFMMQFDAPILV